MTQFDAKEFFHFLPHRKKVEKIDAVKRYLSDNCRGALIEIGQIGHFAEKAARLGKREIKWHWSRKHEK